VLDNYPTSSVASNAQYQIGYAWMTSSMSGDYDQGAARKAIDAFQDYLVRYPSSDKAYQAQMNIQKLGQRQTQGAFDIAKFYESQHPPDARAAFIYYNEVVREDPNSAQAQIAKKRIQELRPKVEALPGGLGPDGSGTPSPPVQTVASAGSLPASGTPTPDPSPDNTTNSAPQSPAAGTLPADPNAPVTSSSPGATAADADGGTNAAPVASPPDKTPLPQ
jgi:outer membrane protein assembly factor BamD